ncbi:hypothetical protein EYF80_038153 [Liparis tanakae]|uniref:Uncharacterized protein n=1 Tax=Liparis tanakae TaxID=230148 RepID=A0A4Z2GDJ2_9TELE|nr:hypothetical protein EYF80_038153 [Liparis tanakae]
METSAFGVCKASPVTCMRPPHGNSSQCGSSHFDDGFVVQCAGRVLLSYITVCGVLAQQVPVPSLP